MSAYADQPTGDIDMEQSTETEPGLQKQSDEEAVEFEQCLQVTDVQMSRAYVNVVSSLCLSRPYYYFHNISSEF